MAPTPLNKQCEEIFQTNLATNGCILKELGNYVISTNNGVFMSVFTFSGYHAIKPISQSKQFIIYRGKRLSDNKKVILKSSRPEYPNSTAIAQLQSEYQILQQLADITQVINTYELLRQENRIVLVLEDIGGRTLSHYQNNQPLNLEIFFKIAIPLCETLAAIHQQNIIHKDINPNNVIISSHDLSVRLIDFSIAQSIAGDSTPSILNGNPEGTIAYLSPEQTKRMNFPIDSRSDLYSFGVMLFQLLTGQLPFVNTDPLAVMHSHLFKTPALVHEINANIPSQLSFIIQKLLKKIPDERYASALGLKEDLIKCQSEWESKRYISHFALATKDYNDRLLVTQKLYGRDEQIKLLLDASDEISKGKAAFVLISGYSGIGKTSLVKEWQKNISHKNIYLGSGKFDQFNKELPYSAFIAAIQGIVCRILTEREDQLANIRNEILKKVGNNGKIITDILPSIIHIIGEQPVIPDLPASECENRFLLTFQNFIAALTQPEHPLIIFLDDLQWVDTASLKLIETLTRSEPTYFLLIGAYRDNEVSPNHPLLSTIHALRHGSIPLREINISTLSKKEITQFLADLLSENFAHISPLADLIMEKTQGNPFFCSEFLRHLYDNKLLRYCYSSRHWVWQTETIENLDITDNVINLLVNKIQSLDYPLQSIIKIAAVIGYTFDLHTLASVSQLSFLQVTRQLWQLVKLNLICTLDNSYKLTSLTNHSHVTIDTARHLRYQFIHDRVQQAAYQLLDEWECMSLHLHINQLLLQNNVLHDHHEKLFDIANHITKCHTLITNNNDKKEMATYCLWAGKKARAAMAYKPAIEYLQTALALISPHDEDNFQIQKEYALNLFADSQLEKAHQIINFLHTQTHLLAEKLELYKLSCEMLATSNKHPEALQLGISALKLVNINIPLHPNKLQKLTLMLKIHLRCHIFQLEKRGLRKLNDETLHATANLICQVLNSAYVSNQEVFIYLTYVNMNLSLKYGYTDSTAYSAIIYTFTIMHELNLFETSKYYYKLFNKLIQIEQTKYYKGKNQYILSAFIHPWFHPLAKSLEGFLHCYTLCRESGDLVFSNYSNLYCAMIAYMIGSPLPKIETHFTHMEQFSKTANVADFNQFIEFLCYAYQCLTKIRFEKTVLMNYETNVLANNNNSEIAFFYAQATKLCFILGEYNIAKTLGYKFHSYNKYTLGMTLTLEGRFYYCLSLTAKKPKLSALSASECQFLLDSAKVFKRWSQWQKENFYHYYLLLKAEIARLHNKNQVAIHLYNEAILAAKKVEANHLIAIINECASYFFYHLKMMDYAKVHFINAHISYGHWQAQIKCKKLEASYPEWFPIDEENTSNLLQITHNMPTLITIDLLTILKSAQTISSEIQLEELQKKLIYIILQNTCAERGALITKEKNEWYIEAEGNIDSQSVYLLGSDNIEARNDLPITLIKFVIRTQEKLLIHTANDLTPFIANDIFLQQKQPKSILILPIYCQGEMTSLIYLENSTSYYAFTSVQTETVKLLSAQAAISLQNARLYYQATHDPLTLLANRNLLQREFTRANSESRKNHDIIAILFLDVDNFKKINDTLGHNIGDHLLIAIANTLQTSLRNKDIAARLGGDEFIIMLPDICDISQVHLTADRLLQKFNHPFTISGHDIYLTLGIGISICPNDGNELEDLIQKADIALYSAQSYPKSTFHFYSNHLQQQIQTQNQLEIELRHALEKDELCLYYQPIFNSKSSQLAYFEALIRWEHPERGMVSAKDFIPLAEKTGLVIPMGEWVLKTACKQINDWQRLGYPLVPIAINISGLQFIHQPLSQLIKKYIQQYQIDSQYLELEFTESILIENTENIKNDIDELRKLNIKITIDDFGTYYSNLSYLKHFAIDKIKIDQTFVRDLTVCKEDQSLIVAITKLAHSLNLTVVAEGIETKEQLAYLVAHDIDELQGFYFAKPSKHDQCTQYFSKHQSLLS